MILDFKNKDIWENCPKGISPWNKYMGIDPEYIFEDGKEILRLNAVNTPEGFKTSGIQTKQPIGSGIVEIKARTKGGNSSWPALWLYNGRDNKYYEIDIMEHFDNNSTVKTGLFMYKHMFGIFSKIKRLFRPKVNTKINKTEWNIYKCEWNEKYIKIYINGNCILTYKNNGDWKSYPQTKEDRKFTLILSMQYDYKGKAKPEQLPLWMDIEYIKFIKNE